MIGLLKQQLKAIKEEQLLENTAFRKGQALYFSGGCQILSQATEGFAVLVTDDYETDHEITINVTDHVVYPSSPEKKWLAWDEFSVAALLEVIDELSRIESKAPVTGKKYTRTGMIKRVLAERRAKAARADYRIQFADNIYGEHILTNEKGVRYRITLRDFENETGYINNPDLRTNKLGTT